MDKSITIVSGQISDLVNKLENQVVPQNASWSKHIKEKLHAFALEAIDQELISDPTNIQAKLWWFVLQLRLKKMPASALCPSYESTIKNLAAQNNHQAVLAGFCALELSLQLLSKEQIKQTIPILDRARENLKDHRAIVDSCLKEVLTLELERAKLRKESKSYLAEIENRISLLKNSKTLLELDSKSIPEQEFQKNKEPKVEKIKKNAAKTKRSRPLLIVSVSTTLLMIIFLGYQLLVPKSLKLSTEEIDQRLAAPRKVQAKNELKFSLASLPINTNTEDDNYKNIAERLESLAEKRKDDQDQRKLDEEKQEQVENQTPVEAPSYTTAAIPKEELEYDISEIPAADHNQENRVIKEKAPLLDPDRLSVIEVTPLDDSRKKTAVDNLSLGDDGRIYGRPRNSVDYPAEDSQTLGGNSVRGYEVEKFAPAKEFITITRTQVYSAPSVTGRTVTVLEDKTILTVLRKFENWLEVRSQSGQLGYVYAQDAVEK